VNRLTTFVRVISGGLFGVVGVSAILLSPRFITWDWLNSHPNRLGLYGCAVVIVGCITWAIIDNNKTRRSVALVTIGVTVLGVLLQILGR
jgi:hypothetical protein